MKAIVSSTSGAVRRRLPYRSFYEFLFGHASSFKRWWVDPRSAIAVVHALGRDRVLLHQSVVQEMKEVKNRVEIAGMQGCHARDCGAAVLNLLCNFGLTFSAIRLDGLRKWFILG